jgi:hypothetical protein
MVANLAKRWLGHYSLYCLTPARILSRLVGFYVILNFMKWFTAYNELETHVWRATLYPKVTKLLIYHFRKIFFSVKITLTSQKIYNLQMVGFVVLFFGPLISMLYMYLWSRCQRRWNILHFYMLSVSLHSNSHGQNCCFTMMI